MTDGSAALDDPLAQWTELEPLLGAVVDGLTTRDLDLPTPCADFTVQGVLEHMIGGATAIAKEFGGDPPQLTDGGVIDEWRSAMGSLGAAVRSPGALDRTVSWPMGTMPGPEMARYLVFDGIVHGWDLATATGQRYEPPEALVLAAESFARPFIDQFRDGDTFADAVEPPAGASPIERLAAYTGRPVPFA